MDIAAIPTKYKGHLFRSRLEARWAAFFDRVRWPWMFEPIDAAGWIPDFLIGEGAMPQIAVEVKPSTAWEKMGMHHGRIERSGWAGRVLLVGATATWSALDQPPGRGVIGQLKRPAAASWEPGTVAWCPAWDMLALGAGTWDCLLCGGKSVPLTGPAMGDISSWVARRWAEAGNDTRWRG